MEALQGSPTIGDGDNMLLVAFVSCLGILLLSVMGAIGVIVLYYHMDRRRRHIMAAKSVAAASNIINQGKQQQQHV